MSRHANLFVVTGATSDPSISPIDNTTRITTSTGRQTTFELYAGDPGRVRAFHDSEFDQAIYLWGAAAHASDVKGDALTRWISAAASAPSPITLRELHGHFIVVIDDRRRGTISFVSDLLGLRPWYVGSFQNRLIAGSDVPGLCRAGLSSGEVDYDAVASWLQYNFDCTGGSIVRDYKRLSPGAVCTYDATGRLISDRPYAQLEFAHKAQRPEAMIDTLHQATSQSFDLMIGDSDEVTIPLSGGYDSRYIAALASRRKNLRIHLTTIGAKPWETPLARQVADAIGRPLRVVNPEHHLLDLFDDPFAFDSAGFPTGRNLTCAAARENPGAPVISGFLGDRMIRATMTKVGTEYFAKDEQNLDRAALV